MSKPKDVIVKMQRPIYTNGSMNEILRHPDTRGHFYCRNIAIWYDGTMRPARGIMAIANGFMTGKYSTICPIRREL
jgi:hypothetical protein